MNNSFELSSNNRKENLKNQLLPSVKYEPALDEINDKDVVLNIENKNEIKNSEVTKTCLICYENQNVSNFIENEKFPHNICNLCILRSVAVNINEKDILKIRCPDDCGIKYEADDVKFILRDYPTLFLKYLKRKKAASMEQDSDLICCTKVDCAGEVKGEKNSNRVLCPLCGQNLCSLCKYDWKEGHECGTFISKHKKLGFMQCPKCREKLQIYEGYNSMDCTSCKYEFCRICLREKTINHYEWYNIFGCPKMQFSKIGCLFCFSNCRWLCIILKAIILILFLLCSFIVIELGFILYAPILAIKHPFESCYEGGKNKINNKILEKIYPIFFTIGVLLLYPISVALIIIFGPFVYIVLILFYNDDD